MRDSEGGETNYLYDGAGRLSGRWAANYDYLTFAYDKGGRLSEKWSPNGVKAEYTYNDDGSLQGIRHVVAGAEKAKHSYLYDAWGNRKEHAVPRPSVHGANPAQSNRFFDGRGRICRAFQWRGISVQ